MTLWRKPWDSPYLNRGLVEMDALARRIQERSARWLAPDQNEWASRALEKADRDLCLGGSVFRCSTYRDRLPFRAKHYQCCDG